MFLIDLTPWYTSWYQGNRDYYLLSCIPLMKVVAMVKSPQKERYHLGINLFDFKKNV